MAGINNVFGIHDAVGGAAVAGASSPGACPRRQSHVRMVARA